MTLALTLPHNENPDGAAKAMFFHKLCTSVLMRCTYTPLPYRPNTCVVAVISKTS